MLVNVRIKDEEVDDFVATVNYLMGFQDEVGPIEAFHMQIGHLTIITQSH